jgi:hypothetical protein
MLQHKRMRPFMLKDEPGQQQQQEQQCHHHHSGPLAAQVEEDEIAKVPFLEAALAAKDKEIAEKDTEIARLKLEVQRLQHDSVTPQQLLKELELLRGSINDAVLAAAQHWPHATAASDVTLHLPTLPLQQAQTHFEEGRRK